MKKTTTKKQTNKQTNPSTTHSLPVALVTENNLLFPTPPF